MATGRRSFTPQFKRDAAALVVEQDYSILEACKAMDVGETAMRRWVDQLKAEQRGVTPKSKALTAEQQHIQELEKRIKRLGLEKEILKKATVDSNGQSNSLIKILICMRTFDEASKTNIYTR